MIEALEDAIRDRMVAAATLHALLSGTAAVYNQVAPDTAALPFVVFDCDYYTDNTRHGRGEDVILTIRAVAEGYRQAGSIDAAVDTLFHNKPLTVSGWGNFFCARRRSFPFQEQTPGSRPVWHQVGEYDVWLEEE